MGKFDGKVAIVTGAARGLGRAYAKRLAELGCQGRRRRPESTLILRNSRPRNDMTADSTVAEVEAAGGSALGIEMNVRDPEAVEAMVARVVQEWAGSIRWSQTLAAVGSPDGHEGQHPRPGASTTCDGDEPVRDRLFV
jgi:NAD(P)-dependent dehydrogenase (short-subunit alcohol dehydrogenase family)